MSIRRLIVPGFGFDDELLLLSLLSASAFLVACGVYKVFIFKSDLALTMSSVLRLPPVPVEVVPGIFLVGFAFGKSLGLDSVAPLLFGGERGEMTSSSLL